MPAAPKARPAAQRSYHRTGVVLLQAPMGYLQTSPLPPLLLSILGGAAAAAWYARERLGLFARRGPAAG